MSVIMKKKMWILVGIILVVVGITTFYVGSQFHIDTIQVVGNEHYTEEEIKDIVMSQGYINNSLVLFLKNKIKPIENIPFIETIDIEYVSKNKITVEVYEKAMAGCVYYMEHYMYFDKDGIVLETSKDKLEDVPCISGLKFQEIILHQKLPIEDEKQFSVILKITQLIQKYELSIEKVQFNQDGSSVIYTDNIKIMLGNDGYDEKISKLPSILKEAKGLKGTLHMEEYEEGKSLSFTEE